MIIPTRYKGVPPHLLLPALHFMQQLNSALNLHHREDEDILQELLLAAIQAEKCYKPGSRSLPAYIYSSLRFASITIKRRYATSLPPAPDMLVDFPDVSLPSMAEHADLAPFLRRLSPIQQDILRLLFLPSSHRAISKELALPLGQIRKEVHHIRSLFRKISVDTSKKSTHFTQKLQ